MTIKKLTEIIATGDNCEIMKQLQELGYIDCRQDKGKLGNICVTALFSGDMKHTTTTANYKGTVITNVPDCDNCEFIVIVDNCKNISIYGKENN